ncbi:MAG: hypothetical protein M1838_003365 [Thelocarpon superellum]|nr:MAG: hypothetical protein M1838_003365 [Thelocarpon superellum]
MAKSLSSVIAGSILIGLVLLMLGEFAQAAPQPSPSTSTSTGSPPRSTVSSAPTSTASGTCGFQGDDNIYGLGIRLGVYLQWLTSSVAYNFVPDEAVTMRGVNTCFTLSNFAGLLYITLWRDDNANSPGLYAVECWIVIGFCVGGVFTGRVQGRDDNAQSTSVTFAGYKASAIGGIIQLALNAAIIYYTIWYLYIGMDTMIATPCSRYAFFFARVDLFHWFRTLSKVIFTMTGILVGLLLVGLLLGLLAFIHKMGPVRGVLVMLGVDAESDADAKEDEDKHQITNVSFSFTPLAFFVAGTEMLIRWNNIAGVNTIAGTGQLLPVIVAGGGLLRVVWKSLIKLMSGAYTT